MISLFWFTIWCVWAGLSVIRSQWICEIRVRMLEQLWLHQHKDKQKGIKPKFQSDDFEQNVKGFFYMMIHFWVFDPEEFCKPEFWKYIKNIEV